MSTFKIAWEERSHHEVTVDLEEMADLLGVAPDILRAKVAAGELQDLILDADLENALSDYDGFEFLTREFVEVEPIDG